jgi:23S rRNA pseudouridine2604 synthase
MTESIRLAKRVAEVRACSRREAELLICGGWVRVAGKVIEEPQFRVSDEVIEIDADANPAQAEAVTLLLHKPAGIVTPMPQMDQFWTQEANSTQPLKVHLTRLTACAPLPPEASGLVVYTQDWKVARKLTEDAATVEHEIVIEVADDASALAINRTPEGLKRLNQGVRFNGRTSTSLKVSWQSETRLRVAVKDAQIDMLSKLCESVGLNALSIKRIRLGGVSMGKLPPGAWRYLRADERF